MKSPALAALTIAACAPTITYDLDEALAFTVDPVLAAQPLADPATWRRQLNDIAAQLGSRATDDPAATPNHVITLVYAEHCDGLTTSYVDGEYGQGSPNGFLHLCRGFLTTDYLWPEILAHEVGHILGAPHIACNGRNVMCRTAPHDVPRYSVDDLAAICRWSRGGVCGR